MAEQKRDETAPDPLRGGREQARREGDVPGPTGPGGREGVVSDPDRRRDSGGAVVSPFACEVFPRAGAAPAALKDLGRALVVAAARADRACCNLDVRALRDLLAGELPGPRRPLPEEALAGLGPEERRRAELLLGPGSGRPSVYITAWGEDGRRAAEGLRRQLPGEAVEDVLIYGLG